MNKVIIGITGASASGKTLFARKLQSLLGIDNCILISQDDFYKTVDITNNQIEDYNFDEPNAIDYDSFYKFIIEIQKDNKGLKPTYSFEYHSKIMDSIIEFNGKFILVEGIFCMNNDKLNKLMDLKIFIDTGLDICLSRRIKRDINERGRNIDSVIKQYHKFVRPGYFKYIEPLKRRCDIIVPNEEIEQYQRALQIVASHFLSVKD